MGKLTIFVLLLAIFSIVAFVNATVYSYGLKTYDDNTGEVITQIHEGWNLLPWGVGYSQDNSNCDFQHYGLLFYSPTANNYATVDVAGAIMTYTLTAQQKTALENAVTKDRLEGYRYLSEETGAFFFYSFKDCSASTAMGKLTRTDSLGTQITPEQYDKAAKKIRKGWNFLAITPAMTEKPLNNWIGSCVIKSINSWDSKTQEWTDPSNAPVLDNSGLAPKQALILDATKPLSKETIGLAYAFEFENDCEFSL